MGSSASLGPRKDLASALDRVALVLIGIYLVQVIAAVIPPHINDPKWLTAILDTLRGLAFLPLIATVLIFLANQIDRHSPLIAKHRKWVRKLAPLAALGFFLIIPLQGLASYRVLGESTGEAMQKVNKLTRAVEMIRIAQDETALRQGINAAGISNISQEKLIVPITKAKEQFLYQLNSEVLKAKNAIKKNYNRSLQNLVYQWLRDGAVAFLYGFGFRGVSKPGEMVADKLGIGHELIGRLEEDEEELLMR